MTKKRVLVSISKEMAEYSKESGWINRSMVLEIALRRLWKKYPHTKPIDVKKAMDECTEQ
jgi:hypothetical protein